MAECKRCGEELAEYCEDCQSVMLSEAIAQIVKERQENAPRYKLVPIDEVSPTKGEEG
jgi:hypothetical protein